MDPSKKQTNLKDNPISHANLFENNNVSVPLIVTSGLLGNACCEMKMLQKDQSLERGTEMSSAIFIIYIFI